MPSSERSVETTMSRMSLQVNKASTMISIWMIPRVSIASSTFLVNRLTKMSKITKKTSNLKL